jgi:hypothetical protein
MRRTNTWRGPMISTVAQIASGISAATSTVACQMGQAAANVLGAVVSETAVNVGP